MEKILILSKEQALEKASSNGGRFILAIFFFLLAIGDLLYVKFGDMPVSNAKDALLYAGVIVGMSTIYLFSHAFIVEKLGNAVRNDGTPANVKKLSETVAKNRMVAWIVALGISIPMLIAGLFYWGVLR